MHTSEVFIGGQWRPPASGETYATINPATEEASAQVAKGDERDIDLAVQAARRAFDQGPWPRMAAAERARMLWKLADLITGNLDEMARLESINTGKTLFDSGKVELPFAAEVFRYYAGWTTKIHGDTLNLREGAFTFKAPWGEDMVARPGDAIVRNPQDPADTYRVAGLSFACTYEVVRAP